MGLRAVNTPRTKKGGAIQLIMNNGPLLNESQHTTYIDKLTPEDSRGDSSRHYRFTAVGHRGIACVFRGHGGSLDFDSLADVAFR